MTDLTMITGNGSSTGKRSLQPEPKRQRTNGTAPSQTFRMAYLGPAGTYGEMAAQAFRSRYDEEITLVPCPTIPSIWETSADFHVMPLENRIHGGVTETLDSVLSVLSQPPKNASAESKEKSEERRRRRVRVDLALPIRHCLVVKKGTKMEDIQWVRSHEQALGQSSEFLSTHLPKAERQQWTSTAAAAVSLLDSAQNGLESSSGQGVGAAICSKGVVKRYPDLLEVLYEGTQAVENNYTRFLLFDGPLSPKPRSDCATNPSSTSFYTLPSARDIGSVLRDGAAVSIHPRPAPTSYRQSKSGNGEHNGDHHGESSGNGNGNGHGRELPNVERDGAEDKFPTWYLVETTSSPSSTGPREGQNESDRGGGIYLGRTEYRITEEELNAL